MPPPPIDLKLSQKGFMLVGMMLFFELGFVASLYVMLAEAEAEALKEAHSKEIVARDSKIFHEIFDGGRAGAHYMESGNPDDLETFHKNLDPLPTQFKELKELVKDNPSDLALVTQIEKDALSAVKLVTVIVEVMETGNMGKAMALHSRYHKALDDRRDRIQEGLNALKDTEEKYLSTTPEVAARNRLRFKYILVAGVIANIVAAVVACLMFVRGITSRIEVLVDNASRVAKGMKLQNRLPGHDEIAHLDEAFHEMNNALEAAKEKEREIDRMKQEFMAMVSHDLRTPLTAIQGYIQLVTDGVYGDLSQEGKDRSIRAEKNIDRLMRLVNDILDLNKIESGKLDLTRGDCKVASFLQRSVDSVAVVAEKKNITIKYSESSTCVVYADEDRLVQVLVNLLGNALKFSPDGTTITIDVDESDDLLYVGVVDQGPGIPEAAAATLFDRFSQVNPKEDRKKGGTGLGLSICKAIIEGHGGDLGVTSKLGEGSTFWFKIPQKQGQVIKLTTPETVKSTF